MVAASLGDRAALTARGARRPADVPAAIVVAPHRRARYPSALADLWGRHTARAVRGATHGTRPRLGTISVAPPDHQMRVTPDGTLTRSHRSHAPWTRLVADPLRAAAAMYGALAA